MGTTTQQEKRSVMRPPNLNKSNLSTKSELRSTKAGVVVKKSFGSNVAAITGLKAIRSISTNQ